MYGRRYKEKRCERWACRGNGGRARTGRGIEDIERAESRWYEWFGASETIHTVGPDIPLRNVIFDGVALSKTSQHGGCV